MSARSVVETGASMVERTQTSTAWLWAYSFFGIGDEFGRYESYFRTMSPSTTLALVEEVRRLREALGRIEEIAGMVDHVEFYTAESALGDLQAIRMIAVHSRHLPALGEAGRD
jgi:hypothetical protein